MSWPKSCGNMRGNQGKTCAFNKSGEAPTRIEALQAAAARVDPDARVWRSSFWSSCSPTFLNRIPAISGSAVRVALAVVLRCCASQLLLEDHQP